MKRRIVFLTVVYVICLLSSNSSTAAEPLSVTATVDRTSLAVNQQLTFTIQLSGEGANTLQPPELPDMGGYLALLGAGGTSQNIQFINGQMSVSKSFTYYYVVQKEGSFQIPAVTLTYKGKTIQSDPIAINISKTTPVPAQPNATPSASPDIGETLFVRAIVNKSRVFQNEPVFVTYRIYMMVGVTSYNVSKLPETAGFWAEDFEMSGQPAIRDEVVNGVNYRVADIKRVALFPTSPGKKTIGSIGLECDVRVQRTRRSRDIFDSFFDDPFFGRTVRKSIQSDPVSIDVMALPDVGKPSDFSGAVGSYEITADIDKREVKTNEAISLKVKISGTGNIKILPTPGVQIPNDFEQYEPTVREVINRTGNRISGSKTFEYVLVPRFPGQQRIKPISFSFFDPSSKSYKTLTTEEILIDVEKGSGELASASSGWSKEEVRLIGQDIRFIKTTSPRFTRIGYDGYKSPLFILLTILPLCTFAGAVLYRNHQERLSENVAYARSRQANRLAMKKLGRAKSLLTENTRKEFYAEASRALAGFAADKLNVSAAGIITSDLHILLQDRGLGEELTEEYIRLIQTCDYQRFSPTRVSREEMEQFYQKAKDAIIRLEKAI
jgi:hypothetical protein